MHHFFRTFMITVAVLFTGAITFAQSSTNYSVANLSNGTLASDMNGNVINTASAPNLLSNSVSNAVTTLQPIGFDFYFMGKYFSHFVCTDDGVLSFGIAGSPIGMLFTSIPNDLTRPVVFP